jgi:signal transduction histidine kinase
VPSWAGEVALVVAVAAVQVGGTALASRHQAAFRSLDVLGLGLLAAGAGSVLLRRRSPEGALAVAFTTTAAYWAIGFPRGPIFLAMLVTFASAVLAGRRQVAVGSLVAGFVVFSWSRSLLGRGDAPSLAGVVGLGAWLVTILSVAELVRARRDRTREAVRSREEALRRQAADERVRIAHELHDAVAHNMSLINIQAGVALHLMGDGAGGGNADAKVAEALATIKQASREALVEMRSILGVLRAVDEEAPRAPTPSLQQLDELVATAALSGVDVRLDLDLDLDMQRVPRPVDLAAYRIIQESLTNVARHSDRPEAVVRVAAGEGMLTVEVLDEGSGRAPARDIPSGGNGIAGMRERAASVGGELSAGARAGRGFAVRAQLPLRGDG